MFIRRMVMPLALVLNACVPAVPMQDTATRAVQISASDLPPMKSFGAPRPSRTIKANSDIALDF
ncbi:MAG: ATP-dependent transcriptional regulator, partial [Pseudomonadota bacterium]